MLEEASSGSRAGPGTAAATGLIGFPHQKRNQESSILGPSMRIGTTGFRQNIWPSAAHGTVDTVLVTEQAGPDDYVGMEGSIHVVRLIFQP